MLSVRETAVRGVRPTWAVSETPSGIQSGRLIRERPERDLLPWHEQEWIPLWDRLDGSAEQMTPREPDFPGLDVWLAQLMLTVRRALSSARPAARRCFVCACGGRLIFRLVRFEEASNPNNRKAGSHVYDR